MLLTSYSPLIRMRKGRLYLNFLPRINVYLVRFTALPQHYIFPHETRKILALYPYVIFFSH